MSKTEKWLAKLRKDKVISASKSYRHVKVIVPAEAEKKDVSAQALNGEDHREVVYIDPVYSMNGLRRKFTGNMANKVSSNFVGNFNRWSWHLSSYVAVTYFVACVSLQ